MQGSSPWCGTAVGPVFSRGRAAGARRSLSPRLGIAHHAVQFLHQTAAECHYGSELCSPLTVPVVHHMSNKLEHRASASVDISESMESWVISTGRAVRTQVESHHSWRRLHREAINVCNSAGSPTVAASTP